MVRKVALAAAAVLLLTACSLDLELPGRGEPAPERTPAPRLPRATPTAPPAEQHVHIVAPGETLAQIAGRYETTVSALAEANSIADPSRITVGQVIVVPGGDATLVICDVASLARATHRAVVDLDRELEAGSAHVASYLSLVDYLSLRALDDTHGESAELDALERSLAQLSIYLSRLNSGHISWSEGDLAELTEALDDVTGRLPEPGC